MERIPLDIYGNPVNVFGPNSNCTLEICPLEYSVYRYRPSLPANYALIAFFSLAIFIHVYLGWRWKSWWFAACMATGCVVDIIGYAFRVALHHDPFWFIAFIIQIVCITTAPVFFCAGIYITIGKAVIFLDPSISRIRPYLYYVIFIICDIISLIFQGVGGALSSVSEGTSDLGIQLAMTGLVFQIITIVFFCALFGDYLFRYVRNLRRKGSSVSRRLKIFFSFMGLAIALILARCSYRAKELEDGYEGELIYDEPLFIALEGVVVVVAVYCLCIGHPGFGFKEDLVRKVEFDSGESGITK